MKRANLGVGAAALLALGLAGCASDPFYGSSASSASGSSVYTGNPSYSTLYGRVSNIELVRTTQERGATGAGALIGGVVGGLAGSQIGSGRGQDAATVAGAVGGAIAGHQIEKSRAGGTTTTDYYRVTVRLDNGSYQSYDQESVGDLRVGDRVRVDGSRVVRY